MSPATPRKPTHLILAVIMLSRVSDFSCKITVFPVLLLILSSRGALGQSGGNGHLVNGILGELVKLPGIVPEAEPKSVTWYFTNRVGEKTVACDKLINNPVACYFGARDRFTLNTSDYSLEIQSVGKGDWGRYDLTVISTTGNVSNQVVELHVYERVSQPTIQVNSTNSTGLCNVTLSCSVERGSEVIYTWGTGGGEVVRDGNPSHPVTHRGRRLHLSLDLPTINTVYNCTVRNPISEETESIDLATHCPMKGEKNTRIHLALILVPVFLFVAALMICYMKHRRADKALSKAGMGASIVYADIVRHMSPEQVGISSVSGMLPV
uniref:Signaling lymphocytic activation molecule-like n=1 Tax=Callorhinchus milii TaxID=7868 RepID=A0A4W3ILF4_CALMI